jgi:hypothetical protein
MDSLQWQEQYKFTRNVVAVSGANLGLSSDQSVALIANCSTTYETPMKLHTKNFIRMDLAAFEDLLSRVESLISKSATRLRRPIDARERLCLTIRYLATGLYVLKYSNWQ